MARRGKRAVGFRGPGWLPAVLMLPGGALAAIAVWMLVDGYITSASGAEAAGAFVFPLFLVFFAWVLLHLGELFRRGDWSTYDSDVLRGGAVVIHLRQLRLGIVVLWASLALLAWVLLIAMPAVAVLTDTGFTSASEDFWVLAGLFGLIAACIIGAFIASFVKRAAHARAAARGRVAPEHRREFWRLVSGQWITGSFLLAIGAGCLGMVPLHGGMAAAGRADFDTTLVVVLAAVGVAFSLAGVLVSAASWRTGEEIGYAESVA